MRVERLFCHVIQHLLYSKIVVLFVNKGLKITKKKPKQIRVAKQMLTLKLFILVFLT